MEKIRFLDAAERCALADALGETPQTLMSVHRLRRGLARAVVDGTPERPRAAIVQAHTLMTEPAGFGDDPDRIYGLLRGLDGWTSVHVAVPLGPPLVALIEAATGHPVTLEEEIYFQRNPSEATPATPAALVVPGVRRLSSADVPLMEAATDALGMTGWRFGSAAAQVAEGVAAGAVVEGRLVAVAFTASRGERYGEVGIATLAPHRGRGYAAATAALVAADIEAAGLTVVWSTGVTNTASRRVATKLGLTEVSRRVYVNLT